MSNSIKEFRRSSKLTKHFTFKEMTTTSQPYDNIPNDITILVNLLRLCHLLEHYRIYVGPLIVNSAYRTPIVNNAVGGHPNSYHLKGLAADVRSTSYTPRQLREKFTMHPHPLYKCDIVEYPQFVHIEITHEL